MIDLFLGLLGEEKALSLAGEIYLLNLSYFKTLVDK